MSNNLCGCLTESQQCVNLPSGFKARRGHRIAIDAVWIALSLGILFAVGAAQGKGNL